MATERHAVVEKNRWVKMRSGPSERMLNLAKSLSEGASQRRFLFVTGLGTAPAFRC